MANSLLILLLFSFAASAADFDHYLLALSWSPEFCYSHPGDPQCNSGRHLGFVVHGLWPESRYGRGPEHCRDGAERVPISRELLEIMPDPGLIRHEWSAHGSCTGLSPEEYFALVRRAFFSINIPGEFQAPHAPFSVSPAEMKLAFERANPGFAGSDIQIGCRDRYLSAVEICLTKGLRPMPCPAVHDCYVRTIRVTAVR